MFDLEMSRRLLPFSAGNRGATEAANVDKKWLPVSAKSTKMGRQAAGAETTVEDT
jgi:hypothetical protein